MSQEIAQTILSQLGGAARLKVMLGASSFSAGTFREGKGISFRIAAKAKNKAKAVKITLAANDTYMVEFLAVRGFEVQTVGKFEGIYCDKLKETIESATGLMLSL